MLICCPHCLRKNRLEATRLTANPVCGPCQQFAPTFSQSCAANEPRARFLKVDTEAAPELAARFAIRSIPTLIIIQQGKELARLNGALPPGEFARWLQQQLPG